MLRLILLVLSFYAFHVYAQSKVDVPKWDKGGNITLTLAQGGTRNWSPGGDRFSLAINGFATLYANKTIKKRHWDNLIEANYGLINTRVAGLIKNDDKLDVNSRWSVHLGKTDTAKYRFGIHFNFRSQFYDGFDYDGLERKRISAFLAPAIVVLAPGFQYYSPNKNFNIHFSPYSPRWILVPNRPYELAANYGVRPNKKVKIEAGSFASFNYKNEVLKNIDYRSRLDLFSNFVGGDPSNIDVFWTNMFYMKINKVIAAVYNFDLQYDDDTRIFGFHKRKPGTQLKSIFGAGLSFRF